MIKLMEVKKNEKSSNGNRGVIYNYLKNEKMEPGEYKLSALSKYLEGVKSLAIATTENKNRRQSIYAGLWSIFKSKVAIINSESEFVAVA